MKHYILVAANGIVGDLDLSVAPGPFKCPEGRLVYIKDMYHAASLGQNTFNPTRDIVYLLDVDGDQLTLTRYEEVTEENRYYLEDGDTIYQDYEGNNGMRLLVRKCTATDTVDLVVDPSEHDVTYFTTDDGTSLKVQWEDGVPYVVLPNGDGTVEEPELDKIEAALREAGANDHYISVIMDPIDPDAGDPWGQAWNTISSEISFFKDLRDAVQR